MRTTININDNLLNEAKKLSISYNTTLSSLIESALQDMLSRRKQYNIKKPVKLKTYNGNGVRSGIDLDDTASLLNAMEDM